MYRKLTACRVCDSALTQLFSFGDIALTGVFPKVGHEAPKGPLTLQRCTSCKLVQLGENYNPDILYGNNYGYRSGLNKSMEKHLYELSRFARSKVSKLVEDDIVLDIGSNDGTLLRFFPDFKVVRIGIDPLVQKYGYMYDHKIFKVNGLFDPHFYKMIAGNKKAKIITSIAMLYDLPSPRKFFQDVASILAPDGVWVTEQADLNMMLKNNAYDSICHEHLEYYTTSDIALLAESAGLEIIDIQYNSVNGGSTLIALKHRGVEAAPTLGDMGIPTDLQMEEFCEFIEEHPYTVNTFFRDNLLSSKKIYGYGASTKGNMVLQHCYPTQRLECILDVNPDKAGCWTPGSHIPITLTCDEPDFYLVLPWHFRDSILKREKGKKFIFLLPTPEIVQT